MDLLATVKRREEMVMGLGESYLIGTFAILCLLQAIIGFSFRHDGNRDQIKTVFNVKNIFVYGILRI